MPQFSTNELVSLEKDVVLNEKPVKPTENINQAYEIDRCVQWIKTNGFQKVCVQFPDYLLPDSSEVALRLQEILDQTVYILGDTAYESCCVDYVAAAHINADAIIHFGPTCFSKSSRNIPYLYVFEKHPLNVSELETCFKNQFENVTDEIWIVVDSGYIHKLQDIQESFRKFGNVNILKINEDLMRIDGSQVVIFIGENNPKLMNVYLTYRPKDLYYISQEECTRLLRFQMDSKVLKRRYFLAETIKDSRTIGIVIGTLAIQNYLKVIDRMKQLISLKGKKYYLISVGKPTVAKLANFPEMDIYVMVTCSMNEIYESRDFYKPIVTPFDIELALNPLTNGLQFSYDYNQYFNKLADVNTLKNEDDTPDISLLTGHLRSSHPTEETVESASQQMALKADGSVALSSNFGGGFLNQRSWKGLEQDLGQTDVKLAEEGMKGIAQGYENEMT